MEKRTFARAVVILGLFMILFPIFPEGWSQENKRPMTFVDILDMKSVRGGDLSRNKQRFIFEISALDWKALLKTLEDGK